MSSRKQKLVDTLRRNDARGIPFAKTKALLLDEGYSEDEIAVGLGDAPYDGKPNKKRHYRDPNIIYVNKHPHASTKAGHLILGGEKNRKHRSFATYLFSSQGRHYSARYRSRYELGAADSFGFPYFTFLFSTLAVLISIEKLDWPDNLVYIYMVGFILIYLIVNMIARRS